jgi:hypothetical protein
MKIQIVRIPGAAKSQPAFQILKDGIQVHQEVIAGRKDAQPAFLRAVSFCKTTFAVELYPAGRNDQKHRTWSSEKPEAKTPKVPTELLHKAVTQEQPGVVNRMPSTL